MKHKKFGTESMILFGGRTFEDDIKGLMRKLGLIDGAWYEVKFYATNGKDMYIDSLIARKINIEKK